MCSALWCNIKKAREGGLYCQLIACNQINASMKNTLWNTMHIQWWIMGFKIVEGNFLFSMKQWNLGKQQQKETTKSEQDYSKLREARYYSRYITVVSGLLSAPEYKKKANLCICRLHLTTSPSWNLKSRWDRKIKVWCTWQIQQLSVETLFFTNNTSG